MTLPLAGIRVLDLTRLLPGGFATLLLSGLGADVIKVEYPVGGDGMRQMWLDQEHSESSGHLVLNRGKRSIALDLKTTQGRETMLALISTSQILIDSFRPGVLERLGLGEQTLLVANPQLVHVSIDGFGATGPYTQLPAHDLNSVGYAGGLGLVLDRDGMPTMPPIQSADMAAGMHAALAAVAGLRMAERESQGFRADVAMTDAAASLLATAVATAAGTGQSPPVPDTLTGRLGCYGIYECADGLCVTVGGLEAKFFGRMVELMGMPQLATMQFDPHAQEELVAALRAEFATRPRADWLALLAQEDTCFGPVLDVSQALAEPHFVDRGKISTAQFRDGKTVPVFKSVPWIAEPEGQLRAPELGEHSTAVLSEAGLPAAVIEDLVAKGIVGVNP